MSIIDSERICSGCGCEKETVDRNMFDGLCADCTDRAMVDDAFRKAAQYRNKKLKRTEILKAKAGFIR